MPFNLSSRRVLLIIGALFLGAAILAACTGQVAPVTAPQEAPAEAPAEAVVAEVAPMSLQSSLV